MQVMVAEGVMSKAEADEHVLIQATGGGPFDHSLSAYLSWPTPVWRGFIGYLAVDRLMDDRISPWRCARCANRLRREFHSRPCSSLCSDRNRPRSTPTCMPGYRRSHREDVLPSLPLMSLASLMGPPVRQCDGTGLGFGQVRRRDDDMGVWWLSMGWSPTAGFWRCR